jgi:hypothetical protein
LKTAFPFVPVIKLPLMLALGPDVMTKLTDTPPAGVTFVVTWAVTAWTAPTTLVAFSGVSEQAAMTRPEEKAKVNRSTNALTPLASRAVLIVIESSPLPVCFPGTLSGKTSSTILKYFSQKNCENLFWKTTHWKARAVTG